MSKLKEADLRILGTPWFSWPQSRAMRRRSPRTPSRKAAPAKLAAYAVCRSLAIVDMGPVGLELVGGVHRHREDSRDGSKLLDNLAIRCLGRGEGAAPGLRLHRHVRADGRRRRTNCS